MNDTLTPAQRQLAPLLAELRNVYRQLDNAAQSAINGFEQSEHRKVSCGAGCAGCCAIMTTTSMPEGLLLADDLLRSGVWRERVPALLRAAAADCAPGVNNARRIESRVPCGLLDDSKLCIAYASRPACCRYHVAITPAENCSADAPVYDPANPAHNGPDPFNPGYSRRIGMLNLMELEGAVWQVAGAMNDALGIPRFVQAPISIVTLASLLVLLDGTEDAAWLAPQVEHLPNPDEWVRDHMMDMAAEEDARPKLDGDDYHREQLVQIGRRAFGGGNP